jgi:hypothetical protein
VNLFDADGLAGEDCAEVDFFLARTDAATTRDYDGLIVQRIVDVRQSGVDAVRGLIDLPLSNRPKSSCLTLVSLTAKHAYIRILLDECVNQRMRNHLPRHECQSARYAGFGGLKNGELLDALKLQVLMFW